MFAFSESKKTTRPNYRSWESEELLPDGDSFFSSIEDGIQAAQKSIEIETYIFSNDKLGARIEGLLIAAARRGVAVRVIVDGVGSQGWIFTIGSRLRASGVNVKVYHQLPWERLFSVPAPWKRIRALIDLFQILNRRDHRKLCIVDSTTAWIGSTNITEISLHPHDGQHLRREIGMKISGDGVRHLLGAFNLTWYPRIGRFREERRLARHLVNSSRFSDVRLNSTIRLRLYQYEQLLRRINGAAQRIWIANAYFVPAGSFLKAIGAAARRGVDVRLVASTESDIFFMPWVFSAFKLALIKTGVRLFEYQPGFLHAKYMLIDDWAMVGSSNLNQRSLLHDLEADVMFKASATVDLLAGEFKKDQAKSVPFSMDSLMKLPWWQKLIGHTALLFKHYI